MSDKKPPTLEHQEPPIYYCWKYWTSDGEIREGCTPIGPSGHDTWPDLNDYGWVYVAVPVAIIFVIIFLTYLICSKTGSKNHSPQKKSILLEESESEEEMPEPRSKWSRVRSYHHPRETPYSAPPKSTDIRDFATVVHMAKPDNMSVPDRKVAPRGGVSPYANTQGRVYPQLSQKFSGGPRADEEITVNGRRAAPKSSMNGPTVPPLSNYVNDPTVAAWKKKARTPPTKVEEESSSDDDEASDHDSHSDEANEE